MAVPGKVFFIDCKVLAPIEFEISWRWPLVSVTDDHQEKKNSDEEKNLMLNVVDKSLMHAVIEYRERGQVKRLTAKTSPYIFKGKC